MTNIIRDTEFLEHRPYYADIPRSVLLLPDGSRRFAKNKEKAGENITLKYLYDIGQRKCQDFLEICFNEFKLDTCSIFFLRPTSFEMQRRSNENLESILIAINKLALNILDGKTNLNPDEIYVDTITLAEKPWMYKPDRVDRSKDLSEKWNDLTETLNKLRSSPKKDKTINFLIHYSGKRELDFALEGHPLQIHEQIGAVIRTGDGMRLSDCPLYALSEAHLYLIPKYLPETTKDDFREALTHYFTTI
ncbi:undecaprenyl diphosphate synthase family protein [Candidatus Pacearchaeota archaeon]|nr:undecaprenyl diphosphate synthase family protein [Candidatus Pacearchaeota archaeon]